MKNFFCTYGYLFELIFALLTFENEEVRVFGGSLLRSKILWYAKNFQPVQSSIFLQWKTYFSQFIEKFLKLEEMKYFIHHVWFEMWSALRKFTILFSIVKLNYDTTFPNLSIDSKLELLNLGLRL